MILVLGSLVAQEALFAKALALSQEHVARSRAEPGCISHAVHRDVENPLRLVFVEEWQDQEALVAHFKLPASRAFAKAMAEISSQPPSMSVLHASPVQLPGKSAA
ncbi:antibiotic biosynthesis monooxygenase [Rhizobacter sp. AJA081-3]|jgi:quinol monooxygenase YgiN|uniref:putative quinol monooxygenase n=1 Tax=Rhizobacter sp. AJA081-3 TaxID=2753607 RepID=UPI001ADFF282|nr:putative quinol monooxygenase [Rhizobacter sp. AJA081-3]QTN21471.1 antibiotic biosynthesis monooxygenase [Rhizobacter sp. AJA081-3]